METGKQISISNDLYKVGLISVIIPAYNIEKYISICLNSVLNQTYENIEIIVVDDGSTDMTGEIIDDFCSKYPHKINYIYQKNAGVTSARLNGIKCAHGDWIGFIDGDDEVESNMYERLLRNAMKYHADISHCGYQLVINGGDTIRYFHNTGLLKLQNNRVGLRDLLEGSIIEPGLWNKLYKKKLFQKIIDNDLIDKSLKINEDLLMNYYLFSESQLSVYEDFCPYHYIARPASATRTGFSATKYLNQLQVRETILNHADTELQDIAKTKLLYVCINGYAALYNKEEYKDEAECFRSVIKKHRNSWNLLNMKDKMKVFLVYYAPILYTTVYSVYRKHIAKQHYG